MAPRISLARARGRRLGTSPGSESDRGGCREKRVVRGRLRGAWRFAAIRSDDVRDHVCKCVITRNCGQYFLARPGVRTRAPTNIYGHGVDQLSIDLGFKPAQSNVGGFVISATGWTAGPMYGQGIRWRAKFFLKGLGKRQSSRLCFDQRKIAIIRTDARHQTPKER